MYMYMYYMPCKHIHMLCVVATYSEDAGEGDFRWRREGEHGKVSDESWGDRVPATPWWGTRCTDSHILE